MTLLCVQGTELVGNMTRMYWLWAQPSAGWKALEPPNGLVLSRASYHDLNRHINETRVASEKGHKAQKKVADNQAACEVRRLAAKSQLYGSLVLWLWPVTSSRCTLALSLAKREQNGWPHRVVVSIKWENMSRFIKASYRISTQCMHHVINIIKWS